MANGKIIYPSGATEQVTYTFEKNCDYGHNLGYLDTDDNARSIDGTLNSYAGARKKTFTLQFTSITKVQVDALTLAWLFGGPIDLYLDGTLLDATVKIMTQPAATSLDAFIGGDYTWNLELAMEEV
jgi:hypothetical protein